MSIIEDKYDKAQRLEQSGQPNSISIIEESTKPPVVQNSILTQTEEKIQESEQIPKNIVKKEIGQFRINCCYSIPKTGYDINECEDKGKVKQLQEDPIIIQAAIADGVSQASFSGDWANILVENFVNYKPEINTTDDLNEWLKQRQTDWEKFISEQSLNWIAKRKLKEDGGTYVTFLGLRVSQTERGWVWNVFAIGDCCLFLVKDNNFIESFPITTSTQLQEIPNQLGTSLEYNIPLKNRVKFKKGQVENETHFYLVTDALAGWILQSLENQKSPWETLNKLEKNQKEFESWVQSLRQRDQREDNIRDDDTTLVHIVVE